MLLERCLHIVLVLAHLGQPRLRVGLFFVQLRQLPDPGLLAFPQVFKPFLGRPQPIEVFLGLPNPLAEVIHYLANRDKFLVGFADTCGFRVPASGCGQSRHAPNVLLSPEAPPWFRPLHSPGDLPGPAGAQRVAPVWLAWNAKVLPRRPLAAEG